ncbi:MAG: hypothetical protein M3018_03200 [Actinomycetota bacterium]|nr:hypothetical protein [Actinomycetota bacterium]
MSGNLKPRRVGSLSVTNGKRVDVVEVAREPTVSRRRSAAGANNVSAAESHANRSDRAVLTLLFALSLGSYAIGRVTQLSTLSLAGALGVLFFGVGTAPLQMSRTVSLSVRLAVSGLLGLSTALLIGFAMVLGPLWHPGLFAVLVVVAACVAHAVALPSAIADLDASLSRWPDGRELVRRVTRPSLLFTVAGTCLWLGSATLTGQIIAPVGGFPVQITALWYLGVVLVLAALVLARNERHEGYAMVAVGSLVLALTLTPALVYGMPRSQSAAKHVEFVRLALNRHHLRAGDGIYFAYSAFFDAVAWLCRLTRVSDPTGLATFWPVLMGLIRLAELRLLFGALIEGRYRRWVAITVVVLVDSIGADYFSPQSVGYLLGLGVFALAVSAPPVVSDRLRAALIVIAGLALAVTHELSPYIVGGVLVVLAFARCARPRWAGLAILAPALLWALVNINLVTGFLSLSSLLDFANFQPPASTGVAGLGHAPIIGESSHALLVAMLVLAGGALVGFADHWRQRWAWAYLLSAGVGLMLVAVNPYGHEGIFRAAVFAIPWLALLASYAAPRPSAVAGSAAVMALCVGLFAIFLVAAYGMDGAAVMRRADLRAVRVFERAPANAYLLEVGFGDLPTGPPGLSGERQISFDVLDDRVTQPPGGPRTGDPVALLKAFRKFGRRQIGARVGQLYAIWSPVSSLFGSEYGLQRPGESERWRDLVLASPAWRVVFHQDGTYLLRAVGS